MSLIDVASYTILSKNYPNDTEKAISLYETTDGIAFIVGIIGGALLYDLVGFSLSFVIFAIIMFPLAIINRFIFRNTDSVALHSKEMDVENENTEYIQKTNVKCEEIKHESKQDTRAISYSDLLRKPRILFAALNFGIIQFSIAAFEPTLALRLDDYNTSTTINGLIISISPILMMFSTLLSSYIFPSWVEWRIILITSTLFAGLVTFFIGPFYTETDLATMCIALALSGLCKGSAFAFSLSEMIDCLGGEVRHSNLLSGILFMSFGIGGMIGPGVGGTLYDLLGFRWMCNINALICIVFSLFYFIFADGYGALKNMLYQKES